MCLCPQWCSCCVSLSAKANKTIANKCFGTKVCLQTLALTHSCFFQELTHLLCITQMLALAALPAGSKGAVSIQHGL